MKYLVLLFVIVLTSCVSIEPPTGVMDSRFVVKGYPELGVLQKRSIITYSQGKYYIIYDVILKESITIKKSKLTVRGDTVLAYAWGIHTEYVLAK